MEVRPGYKQTEVGVIPVDWEVKLLPDVLRFRGGKAHEQHISETGRYVCVNSKFISTDGAVRKYSSANFCPAKKGDVLMVMSDLPNGRALAKAYLVEANDTYAVNQRVCALTAYHDCPEYFFYVLNRHPYFLKFDDGVSQTHLLNHVFQKCPIPVPPNVEEQRAIATALSDVDALLGALDRLIAKKRDLKQAAMQQLLTGQTRLPGFHGQWQVKRLGDLAKADWGNTAITKDAYKDHGYPAFSASGQDGFVSWFEHDSAGVVISAIGAQCGKTWLTSGKWTPIKNTIWFKGDGHEACTEFLYWKTCDRDFWPKSGQAQPFVSVGSVRNALVLMPPDLSEQTAIAEVLSDMDAEIAALEQRREKTRALKQGV